MRIVIIASGSRGDVQPYIALAKGLQAAGNDVRLVSHQNYATLAQSHGIEFWPVEGDVQTIVQDQAMQARIEKGNFLSLLAQMAKEAKRGAVYFAGTSLAAGRGMDLVLAGMGGLFTGIALAEKLDLPFFQAYLVPFTPTWEFASVLVPNLPAWLGGSARRVSHHLTRQVIWQGFRLGDQLARLNVLGLPKASFWGPYRSDQTRGLPILYGFSPAVLPAPSDWGTEVHVTGYWFLDAAEEWKPPPALADFLEAGPPPIYIGFGSMSVRNPEQSAGLVLDALRRSSQRAIILSGWGGLRMADLPESALMVDSVPHAWLFPRLAAVVHHGGAGTTAAGLRAGVPSIIVPFFGDQPFWGRRIVQLGVGPEPIAHKKLTVDHLAQALERAVTDKEMRSRAASLGVKIRAEDGVGSAVEIIQRSGIT